MTVVDDSTPAPATRDSALAPIARGGAANLFGAVVTGVAAFALTVIVTRSMSRADAGVLFSTTSLFLLVTTIGQLGTATGVVYFVARARATGEVATVPGIVRTAMRPVVAVGVVATVAMALTTPLLTRVVLGAHTVAATGYLLVLCVFVPVAGAEAVWLAALRGFGSMRVNASVELIGRPLLQLVLVAAVLPTGSPMAIAIAWSAPYVVAAVVAALAWRRRRALLPAHPDRTGVPAVDAIGFWRFTGPRALTSVVQIVMQRFDIVLVAALAGAPAAAVYTAATRFVVAGQSATTAFTQATQPALSRALVRREPRSTREIYQLSTAWLVLLTWPVYLILLVFQTRLLHVFGHGYGAGRAVLVWLSLSMLLAIACGLVDVVLSMAGHTTWNLANAALALACNLGLDLWLIPRHGIVGAAVGWAVAIGLRNLAALVQVALALGLHPVARSTVTATLIATASFGLLPLAVRAVLGDSWSAVAVALLAGSLLWFAAVRRCRGVLRLDAFGLPRLRDARGAAADHDGR